LPDLNTENPLVSEYLIQNATWWAETSGLDGYRIDTFPYVPRAFWSQWHTSLRAIYPRLSTVGEVFHPDPTVTSFYAGGRKGWDGIDTQLTTVFDFPAYFALRDVLLNGAPAGRLTNVLRQDSLYPHPDYLVPFFGNHDTARFASVPGASLAKEALAFGLTLTLRGIPEIYYGDEIGMTGGEDPDNRHDFPGGWTEDPTNAFVNDGRTSEQQKLLSYVKSLLRLRGEHEALRGGRLWHLAVDESTYIFLRESEDEKLVVAFHDGKSAKTINVPLKDTPARGVTSVSPLFGAAQAELAGDQLKMTLPPESLAIFVLR
jgi:glycosidase